MDHGNQPINWYPGHMARTRRMLQEQLKRVDLVIELCDARLPYSSRNPELNRMTGNRKRILFLNKADLADPGVTNAWVRHFKGLGIDTYLLDARTQKAKETLKIIERATADITEKAQKRGIRKSIRAMVVGVPNVGKSTLINRLRGTSVAETGNRPGITRSNQWVKITPYLDLLDTPGMLWPRLDDQEAARRLCYIGSVSDEVVDLESLTISLLEDLKKISPEALKERFHTDDPDKEGTEMLDNVCKGRGWLLKGGEYDYDRCCRIVLDEYRSGKLGRISLESPSAIRKQEPGEATEE